MFCTTAHTCFKNILTFMCFLVRYYPNHIYVNCQYSTLTIIKNCRALTLTFLNKDFCFNLNCYFLLQRLVHLNLNSCTKRHPE